MARWLLTMLSRQKQPARKGWSVLSPVTWTLCWRPIWMRVISCTKIWNTWPTLGLPDSLWAHGRRSCSLRGLIRLKHRDFRGAIADLTVTLEDRPGDFLALANRGVAYRALGEHQAALRDWRELIQRHPGNPETPRYRALVEKLHLGVGMSVLFVQVFVAGSYSSTVDSCSIPVIVPPMA